MVKFSYRKVRALLSRNLVIFSDVLKKLQHLRLRKQTQKRNGRMAHMHPSLHMGHFPTKGYRLVDALFSNNKTVQN